MEQLDVIAGQAKRNETGLASFLEMMKELNTKIDGIDGSNVSGAQLRSLLKIPNDLLRDIANARILKALAFPEINMRSDILNSARAYEDAFHWIFKDKTTVDAEGVTFVKWLEFGSGIFHIMGKLGSGKSTHPIPFKGCTHAQKSLEGMFRSLLHDVLSQWPDATSRVLPDAWSQVVNLDPHIRGDLHIDHDDICEAFQPLFKDEQLLRHRRFFFFIDGLDEFEQTTIKDYNDLVAELLDWGKNPSVKICVSSREDSVFETRFDKGKRLRMQDLTRDDMSKVVHDRLFSPRGPLVFQKLRNEEKESLLRTMLDRAQGVLLWVRLVIAELRKGLTDWDTFAQLKQKVDALPQDMVELFKHLLNSVPDPPSAYRPLSFAAWVRSRDFGIPFSLLKFSFIEDFRSDNNFAMDLGYP
ncbi:hypothetical protein EJ06DRAFT_554712 [Trichodelitschia bisporula]|uniref:Nephrocystin 3-like N-terminal domain-containing protein n=1 Tax=Trichodelitschia bisporula TaxID=703511 RepID=A0A6G1I4T0_9PEZI|nr:hypothetical protein EJ06DRAFT_554712 [Trichodelitschia bisporula]